VRVLDLHRLGELRSISYHREIAGRLAADPRLREAALERVEGWIESGRVARLYALEWRRLLASPVSELQRELADPGERMTVLRSCSPFAGVLDARTRWKLFREARQEMEVSAN
jgi:hypothetical protein